MKEHVSFFYTHTLSGANKSLLYDNKVVYNILFCYKETVTLVDIDIDITRINSLLCWMRLDTISFSHRTYLITFQELFWINYITNIFNITNNGSVYAELI